MTRERSAQLLHLRRIAPRLRPPAMLVLFDNGTPRTLARYLDRRQSHGHGGPRPWIRRIENGELLSKAEAAGFVVLVTTDKNFNYQQNLASREIVIVVLGQGRWSLIKRCVSQVVATMNTATRGSFAKVDIPYE